MMVANFAIWPLAHLINFKFVPSSQRILYINSVQVGHALCSLSLVVVQCALLLKGTAAHQWSTPPH